MKVYLMHTEKDIALQSVASSSYNAELVRDLELHTLCDAMSSGDEYIYNISLQTLLTGFNNDTDTILYRQNILKDCMANQSLIRDLYRISIDAIECKNKHWFFLLSSPSSILHYSVQTLKDLLNYLKQLRDIASNYSGTFASVGFGRFFGMIKEELSESYLAEIESHLEELKFQNGILLSAELGKGNKGKNYILRKSLHKKQHWIQRLFQKKPPVYVFTIHPRDESGTRAITDIYNEAINSVANAAAQSMEHIIGFFTLLRTEIAFYVGCLNLYEKINQLNEPVTFPVPLEPDKRIYNSKGLYDICLALTLKQKITGNDLSAINKNLIVITGANKGGKSTFLRSIGLAQLMMQCGMFVPAVSFTANTCDSMYTHYRKEEDNSMKSGKLDEELNRMSKIAGQVTSRSLLLFNESFSATNDREGSEIAKQIISAIIENNSIVFFVTHLFEFANHFYINKDKRVIFLQAERLDDGTRTYKMIEGMPQQTSYGEDLYNKIVTDN